MSDTGSWHEMELASAVVNRPIIDVLHGIQLGVVHDLYVDAQLSEIAAFFIGHDNMLPPNAGVVELRDVTVFGPDVILVRHSNVAVVANNVVQFPRLAGWIRCDDLIGGEVGTLEGQEPGILLDLILDRNKRRLLGLLVGQQTDDGRRDGRIIAVVAVRALTHDNRLIVDMAAAQRNPLVFRKQAVSPASGSSLN
jgi:sporulation protein YlmC with PRC-barrel domain